MIGSFLNKCRRWVPTAYKRSYNSYKQGKITPVTHAWYFSAIYYGAPLHPVSNLLGSAFSAPPFGWIPGVSAVFFHRGLTVVFCIGEQLSERISSQLPSLVGGEFWVLCAFFLGAKNHGTLKTLPWMCAFFWGGEDLLTSNNSDEQWKTKPWSFRLFFGDEKPRPKTAQLYTVNLFHKVWNKDRSL